MRISALIANALVVVGLFLAGCKTYTSYHRSLVFDTLENINRGALIRTNSNVPDLSFEERGTGARQGSTSEWSDWRFHFKIPATNADVVFQAYHDKILDALGMHADHLYGGQILSNANFRRFIFDYNSGRHEGNLSAYSFISTNGEMWIMELLYEH
jgi:hypothetical protein